MDYVFWLTSNHVISIFFCKSCKGDRSKIVTAIKNENNWKSLILNARLMSWRGNKYDKSCAVHFKCFVKIATAM